MGFIKGIGKAIGGIAKMATGLLSPGGIAGKLLGMLGGGKAGGLGGMLKGLLGQVMGGAGKGGFNPMDMISKFLDPGSLMKGLTGAAGQRGLL